MRGAAQEAGRKAKDPVLCYTEKNVSQRSDEAMQPKTESVPAICLIAPTETMRGKALKLVQEHQLTVGVYLAGIEDARPLAARLAAQGAVIFVSRRGVARNLEEKYPNQVVNVGNPLPDFIPSMEQAAHEHGKIAFFSYRRSRSDLETLCYLMRLDASFYTFSDNRECRERVAQAIREGAVLGIGGADSNRCSEELGLRHLVVESSEQAILEGIERAYQMLRLSDLERRKKMELRIQLERHKTVLNYTHDAVLAINEDGKIDVLNQQAERLLRTTEKSALGKPVELILPDTNLRHTLEGGGIELDQLLNINGTMVNINRVPILVDGRPMGAVATFQDVNTLMDSEKKIRLKLHEKGLTAKYSFQDILGQSASLQKTISMARKYARSNSTVLIRGETGTGKELFAQSIHNASPRANGPFVAINCGSLPQNLLEAELFGYVDGAFTGAHKGGKMGLFEVAHEGTIFLDEIGEMPLETQVHLLRVLQEKEIRQIGGDSVVPVDIRVVAATNRDLPAMVAQGSFREDLYYRLNVLNLEIAPLRERKEDLREICRHTFERFLGSDTPYADLVDQLLDWMQQYDWPGNVREVNNLVERISVLITQGERPEEVLRYVRLLLVPGAEKAAKNDAGKPAAGSAPAQSADEWQQKRILQALQENNYELTRTAEALGIGRTTLWRHMKKYGLQH